MQSYFTFIQKARIYLVKYMFTCIFSFDILCKILFNEYKVKFYTKYYYKNYVSARNTRTAIARIFKHTFKSTREFRAKRSLFTSIEKRRIRFFLSKILKNAKVLFAMKPRDDRQEFFTMYIRIHKRE